MRFFLVIPPSQWGLKKTHDKNPSLALLSSMPWFCWGEIRCYKMKHKSDVALWAVSSIKILGRFDGAIRWWQVASWWSMDVFFFFQIHISYIPKLYLWFIIVFMMDTIMILMNRGFLIVNNGFIHIHIAYISINHTHRIQNRTYTIWWYMMFWRWGMSWLKCGRLATFL